MSGVEEWALRYIDKYQLALVPIPPATRLRSIRDGTNGAAMPRTPETHGKDGASYLTMG